METEVIELTMSPTRPPVETVQKVLLTVKEAADLCSLSPYSINRLIEEGKLPVKYIGTCKRVSYDAIRKWANEEA